MDRQNLTARGNVSPANQSSPIKPSEPAVRDLESQSIEESKAHKSTVLLSGLAYCVAR